MQLSKSKKVLDDVVPHTESATLGLTLAPSMVLLHLSHIEELDLLIVPLICVSRWQLRLELLSEED
jgi:5-formyltetrahydrofolate cyclo-ligase